MTAILYFLFAVGIITAAVISFILGIGNDASRHIIIFLTCMLSALSVWCKRIEGKIDKLLKRRD